MSALMAEQEQNEEIQLAVPGLGDRLKAAREACNLDRGRLAARIHLTTDVVEALERDDYSEMPARVFVRGYVRNYARAVNLPPDSVLSQFDRLWPDEEASLEVSDSSGTTSKRRKRLWWLLPVLVLVALGTAVWWQGDLARYLERPRSDGSTGSTLSSADAEVDVVEGTASTQATGSQPQEAVPAQEEMSGSGELPLPPPPAIDEMPAPRADAASGASDAEAAPAGESEVSSSGAATPLARREAVAPSEPRMVPTPPPAPRLVMRFRHNSWVDIRDSSRQFKLIGIMKAGTERVLGGKPPYNVVIGNARGVELLVNGKPYDLAAHARGNVVRFTLQP